MFLKNLRATRGQILTKVVSSSWYDHIRILLCLSSVNKKEKGLTMSQRSGTQPCKLSWAVHVEKHLLAYKTPQMQAWQK